MDPNETILIDNTGREAVYPLSDLKRGDPFPLALMYPGNPTRLVPSRVFTADSGEVAKRAWTVMVYRETTALHMPQPPLFTGD